MKILQHLFQSNNITACLCREKPRIISETAYNRKSFFVMC